MTDPAEVRRLEAVRNLGLLDKPLGDRYERIEHRARRYALGR